MSDKLQRQELQEIIKEVKEHVLYLVELGVERADQQLSATWPKPSRSAVSETRKSVGTISPGIAEEVMNRITPKEAFSKRQIPDGSSLFDSVSTGSDTNANQVESLEDVWNDTRDCTRCVLCEERTHVVNSEGNRRANLMFVGEAPGADEDTQARPFVGRAGQLLNKIIECIGLKREDVFIGNVNRCRPPQNRTPTPAEGATCKPFILREIDIVRPRVIVVLGNVAMKNLLDTKEGITKLRGRFQDYRGIKVMPTFHPAYLLRDPSKKRETWEDMKTVRDYLNSLPT